MSGGWNAMPEERRAAQRLWEAGTPRKRIAALLGVSTNTVSKWRWMDGWRNRRRYEDRPIRNPSPRYARGPGQARYAEPEPTPTVFRCPWCGGKASDPEGHSACIARNPKAA